MYAVLDRFKSDDEDERGQLIVRETELQRKRKEANSKKAAEGKKSGKSSTSNK